VNLVNLEKVVKGYGQRLLLNGVSAGVAAGERVGVVGRNGPARAPCWRCWPGWSNQTAAESPAPGTCGSVTWPNRTG